MATQGSVRPQRRTKATPTKTSRSRTPPVDAEWLSLRQASDLLGVHPATFTNPMDRAVTELLETVNRRAPDVAAEPDGPEAAKGFAVEVAR